MLVLVLLIISISIVEIVAQSCMKHGHLSNKHQFFYIGGICHLIVGVILYYIYSRSRGISFCNLLWSVFSIIMAALIGKIYFNENINVLALILVLLALLIIYYEEMK